jgi:hypothetical protein
MGRLRPAKETSRRPRSLEELRADAFIDLCEKSASNGSATEMLCRRIQQREWELLFDFCYREAVG